MGHGGASSWVFLNTCSLVSVDGKRKSKTLILIDTQNMEPELIPRKASGDSGSGLCTAFTQWGSWRPRPIPPQTVVLVLTVVK